MFSKAIILFILGLSNLVDVSSAQCASEWSQCGGINYHGPTCCVNGLSCIELNPYYFQCLPATSTPAPPPPPSSTTPKPTTSSTSTTSTSTTSTTTTTTPVSSTVVVSTPMTTSTSTPTPGSSTLPISSVSIPPGATTYTTYIAVSTTSHAQSPYPAPSASGSCGSWELVDNVCCPQYCSNLLSSQDCGYPSAQCGSCITPPPADCMSGTMYNETLSVDENEPWHYSRSTHFGLTSGGACGFGLYGLCTKGGADASWIDPWLGSTCTAFCTAYPLLCQDPTSTNLTMRGNFAAPNGDYYTQFWSSLPGNLDNYLSCGECYELIQTKPDGTDYAPGEAGYTSPIILEIVDSCPCDANSKWCCGPGADHCAEIDFTYGCPLPADSIHLDLSDIAMGRLQGNGSLNNGVIPTRYKRLPCPVPGNVYIWLHDGGGPYYFSLSVVNTYGLGSVTTVEISGAGGTGWTALEHDPNYTSSRPQERYGAWVIPQGSGPFNLPIAMRITNPAGQQVVNMAAITSFTAPASAPVGYHYIDLGVQFTE